MPVSVRMIPSLSNQFACTFHLDLLFPFFLRTYHRAEKVVAKFPKYDKFFVAGYTKSVEYFK